MSGQAAAALFTAPTTTMCVAVYPLVPTRSFDEPLTYTVPPDVTDDVAAGALVEIPVGNAARIGIVAATDTPAPPDVRLRPIGRLLDRPPVPAPLVALAEWLADHYGCARTVALALVVPPKLSAHARATSVPTRRTQQAVRRIPGEPPNTLTKRQRLVLEQLSDAWTSVAAAAEATQTTRATLAKLADLGAVELAERFTEELEDVGEAGAAAAVSEQGERPGVALTRAQLDAVETCESAPTDAPGTVLRGITGSGKTEVYLELISRARARGESAIVLVPEIALTPQTSRRFLQRFPGTVEVLHSGMTRAQRDAAWERIASGASRVVVGPRSAIFAPVRQLGVVVVDEEHDSSYKQDSEPRYDARRVAWRRGQLEGARVVFGSATPRPESWHGVARRALLNERAAGGQLAPVTLVDLRDHGDGFPLTEPLVDALTATLRRGNKAIVLHNRRGYAAGLQCHACGARFRCPNCDVSLVLHGASARAQTLACHHCAHERPAPRVCPECSAGDVARMGAGTERLERDLAERFDVPVLRLDADTTRERGSVATILETFGQTQGPAILTGTQMVAKGHDFPDVELAALVDADTALAIPDFRAEERAFSLVAQLAGRAGRSAQTAEHARVLVQTWDADQEFLAHAIHHDVEGFLDAELARRKPHGYPPFSRLVRVLVSSPDPAAAETWGSAVADGMRKLDAGTVLGPAPLLRLSGRQRSQVLIKTARPVPVAAAIRAFIGRTAAQRSKIDVRVLLDVDPQALV